MELLASCSPAAAVAAATIESDAHNNKGKDQKHVPGRVEHIEYFFDLGPREVHPWHKPAMPSQEKLQQSATTPVIVTPNPMVKEQVCNNVKDPAQELPINQGSFPISTSMFEGVVEVHLKGLATSQRRIFDGKKRCFQVMCQGRFKRPVEASALCMGQEFVKAGNIPPWVSELVLTTAARVFSQSAQVEIYALLPYFMSPLLAACQLVNVSQPGEQPALMEAQEDMRLFAPELVDKDGAPMSADKRRKWCDNPNNLEGKMFDTNNIYTFHIWQHLIDFSSYKLSVGNWVNIDLAAALNGQPLQLTCKDTKADEYAFSMLVWHERLLYGEDSGITAAAAHITEKLGKWGAGLKNALWGSSSSSSSSSSGGGGNSSSGCNSSGGKGK